MNKAQLSKYWREWAAVRRADPAADRHALHVAALGQDKSSKRLSNPEFDLVLAEFWRISHPDSVNLQMRQATMARTRALHTVRSFPAIYVQRLCADRFGSRDPEHLSDADLATLSMTLNNRAPACRPPIGPTQVADPSDSLALTQVSASDNNPF
jgi:hypothetical protein